MSGKTGDKARLQHILDAIDEIESFTDGVNFEDFERDSMLKSACIYQLSIIGEASNHLSDELKSETGSIPWGEIIGLSNIIIHKYFGKKKKVVWDIIQQDLPHLEAQCQAIIQRLG